MRLSVGLSDTRVTPPPAAGVRDALNGLASMLSKVLGRVGGERVWAGCRVAA